MFTEILGLLIVIGVIAILFLKGKMSDNSNKTEQEVKQAAGQLQAELEKAGNGILAKIDRKIDRLEQATEKADRTIEELKRYNAFLAEYINKGLEHDFPAPSLQPVAKKQSAPKADTFSDVLQHVEKSIEPPSQAAKPAPPRPKKQPIPVTKEDVDVQLSGTAKKIFLLLDQGMETEEICRKLSLSKGAVEMIAKMYQTK